MHRVIRRAILEKIDRNCHTHLIIVHSRSQYSSETETGLHLPTFIMKSLSGENVCRLSVEIFFFLYLNSRQWHWSVGRHPVGEHGDCLNAMRTRRILAMVRCRDKWRWEVLGAQVFNLSVTVNNLGRRRFIALLSKCFRRVGVLWPSYWSNWEDVQQSGRNSSEPHRMHAVERHQGPCWIIAGNSSCFQSTAGRYLSTWSQFDAVSLKQSKSKPIVKVGGIQLNQTLCI